MKRKSLFKTISWRIIATSITITVAYLITNRFDIAGTVGAIDAIIKSFSYYAHEHVWDKVEI